MPWKMEDVDSHRQGLDADDKRRWISIANGVRKKCLESGGNEKDCDAKAVKIANSRFSDRFNPAIPRGLGKKMKSLINLSINVPPQTISEHFEEDCEDCPDMTPEMKAKMKACMEAGGNHEDCMAKMKKEMADSKKTEDLGEIEMEIFRAGTHNGDEFTEQDLYEIAENFRSLKNDIRPKLKITHHGDGQKQETLAGLASYGDVEEIYIKKRSDGERSLFARVTRVPLKVREWIKDGRFSERSIELYPSFKLGTKKDSPEYRNVLKAIALLGNEMPAVSGMEPIKLSEDLEKQKTVCINGSCSCPETDEGRIQNLSAKMTIFQASLKI